jgi:hypothetical protein
VDIAAAAVSAVASKLTGRSTASGRRMGTP